MYGTEKDRVQLLSGFAAGGHQTVTVRHSLQEGADICGLDDFQKGIAGIAFEAAHSHCSVKEGQSFALAECYDALPVEALLATFPAIGPAMQRL